MPDEKLNPFDTNEKRLADATRALSRFADGHLSTGDVLRPAAREVLQELNRLRSLEHVPVARDAAEAKPTLGEVMGLFFTLRARFQERIEGAYGGYVDGVHDAQSVLDNHRAAFERVNRKYLDAVAEATRPTALEPLVPAPGVTYADPIGRFECTPTDQAWREESREPEAYTVLELRVMAAHLTTALDNVTQALRAKGAGA